MKARTAGGVGVVLVGIGLLLGLWWKGPGLGGGGSGRGPAVAPPDASSVKATADPGESVRSATARPAENQGDVGAGEAFVTVVIHGAGYRLVSSDDPSRGAEIALAEILERVQNAPGSPEGIRLRILKDRTAQEGARSDLEAALRAAGIKLEQVQEMSGFVNQ